MPTTDLRPLLTVRPEAGNRLACGVLLDVKLHRNQVRDRWDTPGGLVNNQALAESTMRDALARLKDVPALFPEPGWGSLLAVLWNDPTDPSERAALVDAIVSPLGGQAPWRLDAWPLAYWALAVAPISITRLSASGAFAEYDPTQADVLSRAHSLVLAPWLAGRAPVRHLDEFTAFWRVLGPAGRDLVRLVVAAIGRGRAGFRLADQAQYPEWTWAHAAPGELARDGWLQASGPAGGPLLTLGHMAKRLTPAEMLV